MNKQRILITGANGFIGSNLKFQLRNKYKIFSPSRRVVDLANPLSVEKYFHNNEVFDTVIHCAFIGGSRIDNDNYETFYNNLRIFFNLANYDKFFNKFINLGSGAEYGKQRSIKNVSESDFGKVIPLDNDYYGLAKYIISKYIEGNKKFINLRLFGVWGNKENKNLRFISNSICKYILGMPITIKQNVYFDYLYIKDLVKVIDYFLSNKTKYRFYNVGRGTSIDLISIANKINNISEKKSKIVIKNKGAGKEYTGDISRLKVEINLLNFQDFDESLRELYFLYKKNKTQLKVENFVHDP